MNKILSIILGASIFGCTFFLSCSTKKSKVQEIEFDYTPLIKLRCSVEPSKGLLLHGLYSYSVGDSSYAAYVNQNDLSLNIMNFDRPNDAPKKIMLDGAHFNFAANADISKIALDNNKMAFAQYKQFGVYNLETHEMEFLRPMDGTDSLPVLLQF